MHFDTSMKTSTCIAEYFKRSTSTGDVGVLWSHTMNENSTLQL